MARKATKSYDERIAELEKKIDSKKSQIKALTSQRDALKTEVQKQKYAELYAKIEKKKVDLQKVIDFVDSIE